MHEFDILFSYRASAPLKRTASNLSDTTVPKPDLKKAKTTSSAGNTSVAASVDDDDGELEADVTPAPTLDPIIATAGTDEAKVTAPPKKWKEAPYTFLPSTNRHLKSAL